MHVWVNAARQDEHTFSVDNFGTREFNPGFHAADFLTVNQDISPAAAFSVDDNSVLNQFLHIFALLWTFFVAAARKARGV